MIVPTKIGNQNIDISYKSNAKKQTLDLLLELPYPLEYSPTLE